MREHLLPQLGQPHLSVLACDIFVVMIAIITILKYRKRYYRTLAVLYAMLLANLLVAVRILVLGR